MAAVLLFALWFMFVDCVINSVEVYIFGFVVLICLCPGC